MKIRSDERRSAVWHLRSARLSMRIGDPGAAQVEMSRLLGSPRNSSLASGGAVRLMIDALIELKRLDEALFFSQFGLLNWPNSTGFVVRRARIALLQGEFDEAISIARRWLLSSNQQRTDLPFVLAEAYARTEHHADASRIYCDLINRNRKVKWSSSDLIAAADSCLKSHSATAGLAFIDQVVHPPLLLRARLLCAAGRYTEALDVYDRLLSAVGIPGVQKSSAPVKDHSDQTAEAVNEAELLEASLERIEILYKFGSLESLMRLADWEFEVPSQDHRVRMALAKSLVALGEIHRSVRLIRRNPSNVSERAERLAVLLAAAELTNRPKLADRCAAGLLRLKRRDLIIQAERNALFGHLLQRSTNEGDFDTINHSSMRVSPLLESPLVELAKYAEQSLVRNDGRSENEVVEYDEHLARCRDYLHRHRGEESHCERNLRTSRIASATSAFLRSSI